MVKVLLPALAAPQLGPRASSGRAWRFRVAPHSQGGTQPLGPQPPPPGLKRAASKVAGSTVFVHLGAAYLMGVCKRKVEESDTLKHEAKGGKGKGGKGKGGEGKGGEGKGGKGKGGEGKGGEGKGGEGKGGMGRDGPKIYRGF